MNDQFEPKMTYFENFAIALLLRAFPASNSIILNLNMIRPVLIRGSLTNGYDWNVSFSQSPSQT